MANQEYYSIFTEQGLALLRESIQNGSKLGITEMSFGDGNGVLPKPAASVKRLVNQVYKTSLNRLAPSPKNPNWLEADAVIPSAVGGFTIREVGLWAGTTLVAYANYPPTYKPSADQGTAQIKTIRIVLQIDNTANFELKIDASIVMATIQSVEEAKLEAIQHADNTKISHVELISNLVSIKSPVQGQTVFVKSTIPALNALASPYSGASEFIYDDSKKKINDGAITINGWVRNFSHLYVEYFGLKSDGTDQSDKINACLDYAREHDIFNIEFEKPYRYCLSKSVVFKPYLISKRDSFYSTEPKLQIKTNGASFEPISKDFVMFKVFREHTNIDVINIVNPKKYDGVTGLQVGITSENELLIDCVNSCSFLKVDKFFATGIKNGVIFNPYGLIGDWAYGAYYHHISEVVFKDVTHGLIFNKSRDGMNQTTRSEIISYKQNGGACAIVGLSLDGFICPSFNVEHLKEISAEYPEASQRAVYIIEKSHDVGFSNNSINIKGICEDVPKPIYCFGKRSNIDVYTIRHDFSAQNWLAGNFSHGFGGNGPMSIGLPDTFVFLNEQSKMACVYLDSSAPQIIKNQFPPGTTEFYGNIQWIPCTNFYSSEGIQILNGYLPDCIYRRRVSISPDQIFSFGEWTRIDKQTIENRVDNGDPDFLKNNNRLRQTFPVSFSYDSPNSPTGFEFYGVIEWIPSIGDEGLQIAYGTIPTTNKKRTFTQNTWGQWIDLI